MTLLKNPAARQARCLAWKPGKDSSPGSSEALSPLGWEGPSESQLRKTGADALVCLLPALTLFPALPREKHIIGEVQSLAQLTAISSLS